MQMIKPRALKKGDTIGLVGISGAMHDIETHFEKTLAGIDALGFNVIVADSCREQYGYFSGSDESRARGLNQMFADDRVDAVVCMRGGYGVHRMIDKVNFDVIHANPKLFLGYSDITALHTAIHEKCHLITLHGPMPSTDWFDMPPFTRESLWRAMTSTEPLGEIKNPEGVLPKCVVPGKAAGMLVGGNLTLVAAACGTPYALDARGKILLLEDIGESVYRLDGYLTQLRNAGMFDACAGVVLGGFTNCPEEYERYALHLDDVIRDLIAPAGKPVLSNLMIGHVNPKITVPLGVQCELNTTNRTLKFTEPALRA